VTLEDDDTGRYYTGTEKCELCSAEYDLNIRIPYSKDGLVFVCYRCNHIITMVRSDGGILAEYGCRYGSVNFVIVERPEFDAFMSKIKPEGAYEKLIEKLVLARLTD
jgi:hypothetical protein